MRLTIILLFISLRVFSQTVIEVGGPLTSKMAQDIAKGIVNDSLDAVRDTAVFDNVTLTGNSSIFLSGDATQWDDVTVSALSLAGGVQAPTLRTVTGGILGQGFNFQTANDIVYGLVQLPHGWLYGDSIEVHYHCSIEATPSAGDTVVVDFEYSWADIGEVFPTSDTIQVKMPVASWTAKQHKLVEIGWLDGTGKTLSSNIIFRIERRRDLDSDTYDSANNWWILHDIDFHIRKSRIGSNNETSN